MTKDQCKVEGCDRDRRTRGWCGAHYTQWRTTGVEPAFPFTDKGRFDRYAAKGAADDCWQKSIAKEFGVSRSAIQWIASGKHWLGVGEVA